jgi:hypothetical protein
MPGVRSTPIGCRSPLRLWRRESARPCVSNEQVYSLRCGGEKKLTHLWLPCFEGARSTPIRPLLVMHTSFGGGGGLKIKYQSRQRRAVTQVPSRFGSSSPKRPNRGFCRAVLATRERTPRELATTSLLLPCTDKQHGSLSIASVQRTTHTSHSVWAIVHTSISSKLPHTCSTRESAYSLLLNRT